MAEYKIEIRPKTDDGTYPDIAYPKTTADMVVDESNGGNVQEHLNNDAIHVSSSDRDRWNSKVDSSDLEEFIPTSEKGSPGGVATLNSNGKVTTEQFNYDLEYGITTLSGDFPGSTGNPTPGYTYTIVTKSIVIGSTTEEVDVFVRNSRFKVKKGFNYVVFDAITDGAGRTSSGIKESNKNLGNTYNGSITSLRITSVGNMFSSNYNIDLVDMYILNSRLYLKFTNSTVREDAIGYSETFRYLLKRR